MISPMKKYAFLVYHKEYEKFLEGIQNLGVVHVIEKQSGVIDEATRELHQQMSYQQAAINFLKKKLPDNSELKPVLQEDASEIIASLQQLQANHDSLEQKLAQVSKDVAQLTPWGQFSWKTIDLLRVSGWKVSFYSCPTRKVNPVWAEKFFYSVISDISGQTYFIAITKPDEVPDFDIEEIKLPALSLSDLLQEEALLIGQLAEIEQQYSALAVEKLSTLKAAHKQTVADLDFEKVKLNTTLGAGDKLMLLEGWVPADNAEEVDQLLESYGIIYFSQKAGKEDPAPIKLRNNKFAQLFHPITELYEMPAYGEVDLTPFFAPFFVMFFGLCLGDAGYGVLLLLIGLIARRKVKPNMKSMMTLVSILGGGTIVFGFMSGTLFGIELIKVDWPWIQKMKSVMLNADQLFKFSLIIGLVQIVFGMTIKAIGKSVRFGFFNSLSAWGWLIALVGLGGTYALQKFGIISPSSAKISYYIAGGLAFLGAFVFSDIHRNPVINIAAGVWDLYNMVTGLLGDVLSYVRLFALGISGAVLGLVFNDLAMKMKPDIPVVGFLVSALILIFGHGMNIFMSGLGAFVHPLRLTFVEFYKNAGFEGGGKKYTPFKGVKQVK